MKNITIGKIYTDTKGEYREVQPLEFLENHNAFLCRVFTPIGEDENGDPIFTETEEILTAADFT